MSDGGAGTDDNKEYDPTPRKLEEARKKGEVAKSTDLITAAAYAGFIAAAFGFGASALIGLGDGLRSLLERSVDISDIMLAGSPAPIMGALLQEVAATSWPWFALPAIFALISAIAQRAVVFAPSKIAPKLNRISPITGVKNKFGRAGLFEFAKSFTKLVIYTTLLGVFLWGERHRILASAGLTPAQIMGVLAEMLVTLMLIVFAIAATLGGIDFTFQRAEHIRKNRMSRKEMMDELKNSEGDPHMKQQRRQKGMELATNKMLRDVPKADVVVVNPTHYAVALKWSRAPGSAPVCVAKGVDEIAGRIRALAMEHGVPIQPDPPTARMLHDQVKIGDEIRPEHYQAVAAAIRFAEEMRQKVRAR